jgi:dephospho-CoA kinase
LLKVGLTGAIGSGKSAAGKMFATLGAHVTEADGIARELLRPGQRVYEEVVRRFGRDVLNPDGTIHRKKLADAAFGTPEHPSTRVQELNGIIHPAVARCQEEWTTDIGNADPESVAVVEAALIFEAGLQGQFDRIVVVTCPFETRLRRWMSRNQVDEIAARRELVRRMAAQWPEEKKAGAADYVIDNSGSEAETEPQVRVLFTRLKREAVERD